jgi:predicted ATP-grasp superfamily ATP-dependent carboligase
VHGRPPVSGPPTRHRILVTDDVQRASLAIVRSLGRAGHDVYVCGGTTLGMAGRSRFARARATVTDPLRDRPRYVDDVLALARRWSCDMLVPVTEASLRAVLPARDRFSRVAIPFPDFARFSVISDKSTALAAASQLGIAVPEERIAQTRTEVLGAAAELAYPLVLKPSRSVIESDGAARQLTAVHVATEGDLPSRLSEFPDAAFPLLVQRRIVGPGVGVFMLLHHGELLARFSHRRLREKPPSGGVSTYCESIPMDETLFERSIALLRHFGWHGVAMVEYKIAESTGVPYLMEVNGRFWGSLQLAIDAGVDFPALLVAAAAGDRPVPVLEYRIGVRNRWWWGDVDHLMTRLIRTPCELSLPAGAPSRRDTLRQVLARTPVQNDSGSPRMDDPLPFLLETLGWIRETFGQFVPPRRRGAGTAGMESSAKRGNI